MKHRQQLNCCSILSQAGSNLILCVCVYMRLCWSYAVPRFVHQQLSAEPFHVDDIQARPGKASLGHLQDWFLIFIWFFDFLTFYLILVKVHPTITMHWPDNVSTSSAGPPPPCISARLFLYALRGEERAKHPWSGDTRVLSHHWSILSHTTMYTFLEQISGTPPLLTTLSLQWIHCPGSICRSAV